MNELEKINNEFKSASKGKNLGKDVDTAFRYCVKFSKAIDALTAERLVPISEEALVDCLKTVPFYLWGGITGSTLEIGDKEVMEIARSCAKAIVSRFGIRSVKWPEELKCDSGHEWQEHGNGVCLKCERAGAANTMRYLCRQAVEGKGE